MVLTVEAFEAGPYSLCTLSGSAAAVQVRTGAQWVKFETGIVEGTRFGDWVRFWIVKERLERAFEALDGALHRVDLAEPERRFAPLAETVLWIDIINTTFWKENQEGYSKARCADPAGKMIEGLRYARARLVHDILVYGMHEVTFHNGDFDAADFDHRDFDVGTPLWTWRDTDRLPDWDRDQREKRIYQADLEGHEVEPTLRAMVTFLKGYSVNRAVE